MTVSPPPDLAPCPKCCAAWRLSSFIGKKWKKGYLPLQVARDVAKQDLEAAQLRKHEALSEEMRRAHAAQTEESRQWAQTLVERLSNDLRGGTVWDGPTGSILREQTS